MANAGFTFLSRTSVRRAAVLLVLACVCAGGGMASAADDAATRASRTAYEASLKCFVADGIAVGDAQKVHDAAKESYYDTKARLAFDTGVKLGRKLGLANGHINEDFALVQARELPDMIADTGYYKNAVAYCKALGLM